jgi:seryl-tRNA synthetase
MIHCTVLDGCSQDVLEMKKRLRQVQLEMTKLRARQAEVSKEVQKTPVSGEGFFALALISSKLKLEYK